MCFLNWGGGFIPPLPQPDWHKCWGYHSSAAALQTVVKASSGDGFTMGAHIPAAGSASPTVDHIGNAGGSGLQLQAKGKGQRGDECPCWKLQMPWLDPVRPGYLPTYLVPSPSHSYVGEAGLTSPVHLHTGSACKNNFFTRS